MIIYKIDYLLKTYYKGKDSLMDSTVREVGNVYYNNNTDTFLGQRSPLALLQREDFHQNRPRIRSVGVR